MIKKVSGFIVLSILSVAQAQEEPDPSYAINNFRWQLTGERIPRLRPRAYSDGCMLCLQ